MSLSTFRELIQNLRAKPEDSNPRASLAGIQNPRASLAGIQMNLPSIYGPVLAKLDEYNGDLISVYYALCLGGEAHLITWLHQISGSELKRPIPYMSDTVSDYLINCEEMTVHDLAWITIYWVATDSRHLQVLDFLEPLIQKENMNWNELFIRLCRGDHLLAIQHFYDHHSDRIDLHYHKSRPFIVALHEGSLDIIQWLFNLDNVRTLHHSDIILLCRRGQVEILKWVLSVMKVDLVFIRQQALADPFIIQHREMVEYLISLGADYHAGKELLFRTICRQGDLDFAKYLLSLNYPTLREAYRNKQYDICYRLITLKYQSKIHQWKKMLVNKVHCKK